MKRQAVTFLVVVVWSAVVRADLTIVRKTTMEGGGTIAIAGVGASLPTVTVRIKGNTSRTDVDPGATGPGAAGMSAIIDAATGRVTVLDHTRKTARISTPGIRPLGPPATRVKGGRVAALRVGGVKPTGKSQTIDGLACGEYAFTASANLQEYGSVWEMPAVTAARERSEERVIGPDLGSAGDVDDPSRHEALVLKGSVWVSRDAPAVAEYRVYQKAFASAQLPLVSMGATGLSMSGSEKLFKAIQGIDGLPVLAVIGFSIERHGRATDITLRMRRTTMTTKVESIGTDAIGDEVFTVPQGYQIIK